MSKKTICGFKEDYSVNLIGGSNQLTLGTNELEKSSNPILSIYPNPTQNSISLDLSEIEEATKLKIATIYGQIIYQINTLENTTLSIDLSSFNKGVYFVIVDDKKGNTYSQKIIKQ